MYYCTKCKHNHTYTSKIGEKHLQYKENSMYYCTKCKHNHTYTSKIGEKHLQYKEDLTEQADSRLPRVEPDDQSVSNLFDDKDSILAEEDMIPDLIVDDKEYIDTRPSNRLGRFIYDYRRSYRKGTEKFGVWWKVFQLSIWSIILIFLITAGIILVVYLPQIDMINWILHKY